MTSGSITSLLDTLERNGLVRREPHPDDRRKLLVDITDEARRLVDRMLPIVHATSVELLEGVDEATGTADPRARTDARQCRGDELASRAEGDDSPSIREGLIEGGAAVAPRAMTFSRRRSQSLARKRAVPGVC